MKTSASNFCSSFSQELSKGAGEKLCQTIDKGGYEEEELIGETGSNSNSSIKEKDKETTKKEVIKEEPIKEEPIKEEPIKKEPIKEEPIKKEAIKKEAIKEEAEVKSEESVNIELPKSEQEW